MNFDLIFNYYCYFCNIKYKYVRMERKINRIKVMLAEKGKTNINGYLNKLARILLLSASGVQMWHNRHLRQ